MNFIPQIVVLLFSLIVHEVAHGYMALHLGDTTARDSGRLTFNPIPHIDIFGTIIFPVILIVIQSPVLFGWAKPVPINPWRVQGGKKGLAKVSAAGPGSNLLLAVIFGVMFRIYSSGSGIANPISRILFFAVFINIILAIFNLIPIPPLDGSKILMAYLPEHMAERYSSLQRYGFLLLFFLLFIGLFDLVILPIAKILLTLIIGFSPF
ncbi:MAG: site-2 protease family protein [bacterium]